MKILSGAIALLCITMALCGQTVKKEPFKAISNQVKVPYSLYLTFDSSTIIKKDEISNSIFTRVSIPGEKAFSLTDKNKNSEVTYKEFTDALGKNLFFIALESFEIRYFLFYLDSNKDGYIHNEPNITFIDSAITLVESIDHKKYAYDCGAATYDKSMNIRQTGRCVKDGKLSISELRNASLEKKIWIGDKIYWKD